MSEPGRRRGGGTVVAFVVVGCICSAGAAAANKLAPLNLTGKSVVFARSLLGLVVCLAVHALTKQSLRPRRPSAVVARGGCAVACLLAYYHAIRAGGLDLGAGALLVRLSVLWVALASRATLGEAVSLRSAILAVSGLLGVSLAMSPQSSQSLSGPGLALLASVALAASNLLSRALTADHSPLLITTYMMLVGALVAVPTSTDEVLAMCEPGGIVCLGAAAFLGVLAQLSVIAALGRQSAVPVSLGAFAEVAFSIALSALLFRTAPPLLVVMGGAIAMASGLLAVGPPPHESERCGAEL